MQAVDQQAWKRAQRAEQAWWAVTGPRTLDEESKQRVIYAPRMGLAYDEFRGIDLEGRSVLDVGGGPTSMLLRSYNGGRLTVVDPLPWPEWVRLRYQDAGIDLISMRGEDQQLEGYDEVWIYNVLQHVQDPSLVVARARRSAPVLRLFEWLEVAVDEGHPHYLTLQDMLEMGLEGGAEDVIRWEGSVSIPTKAFYGIFGVPVVPASSLSVRRRRPTHFRFHMPGIPHTVSNDDYLSCAFTQKVRKLARMMTDAGHEVYHYGCEGSDVLCTESVDVVTEAERSATYPMRTRDRQFAFDTSDDFHRVYAERAALEIARRAGERDFLCCAWGWGHRPIFEYLAAMKADGRLRGDILPIETGVGYSDTWTPHKAFESYTWMHYVYGKLGLTNGASFDAVIPNYFDPDDFTWRATKDRGDYLLYLGRLVKRKGVEVCVEVAREVGLPLVVAGQGTMVNTEPGEEFDLRDQHVTFAGYADRTLRRELLSRAQAVLLPTYYIEPFGGVAVEAMLSGAPVITSDWGAFAETVLHGVTGFRCRTFEQYCWAAENAHRQISSAACSSWARKNYSLSRVTEMYQEWFAMLHSLWQDGWYQMYDEPRTQLDWMRRTYPG